MNLKNNMASLNTFLSIKNIYEAMLLFNTIHSSLRKSQYSDANSTPLPSLKTKCKLSNYNPKLYQPLESVVISL